MKIILLSLLSFTFQIFSSQVIKDLDGDFIKDTVTLTSQGMIICTKKMKR